MTRKSKSKTNTRNNRTENTKQTNCLNNNGTKREHQKNRWV